MFWVESLDAFRAGFWGFGGVELSAGGLVQEEKDS